MSSVLAPTPSAFFKQGRRVFLTGGSRGIGRVIREEFAKHQVEVICPSRSELDLADADSVARFLNKNSKLEVDILINNAGINFPGPIEGMTQENWSTTLQVNLTSPFLLAQHFSKGMREKKWGRILNISSVFSIVTREGRSAYSATKSGLNGFTRTAAAEWGRDGILVNAICPGYIDTDLTRQNNPPDVIEKIIQTIPLRRLAQPAEIASFATFLCSDLNSYMTGQSVIVDGGFSIQ